MKKFILLLFIINISIICKAQTSAGLVDQVPDFSGSCQPGQTGYASGSQTLWVCHNTGNFIGNTPVLQWVKVPTGSGQNPGSPTGSVQGNISSIFSAVPGFTFNTSSGALTASPTSDAVPLTIAPSVSSPTASLYKIYDTSSYGTTYNLTTCSNATPVVCAATSAAGIVNPSSVTIAGVTGSTTANGTWKVTVSGNNITLLGSTAGGAGTGGTLVIDPVQQLEYSGANAIMLFGCQRTTGASSVFCNTNTNWDATTFADVTGAFSSGHVIAVKSINNNTAGAPFWQYIDLMRGSASDSSGGTVSMTLGHGGLGMEVTAPQTTPEVGLDGQLHSSSGCPNNGPAWVYKITSSESCLGAGGTPGGSSGAIQGNTSSAFAGVPGFTYNTTSGALTAQPASDAVPFTAKCFASGTSDCFEVFNAAGTKAIWADSSGNLNFIGNTATYGPTTTGSWINLTAGSTPNTPAFLQLSQGTSNTVKTYYTTSQTVAGVAGFTTTVPSGDCTTSISGCNVIATFAGGTPPVSGHIVTWNGTAGQIQDGGAAGGVTSFSGDGALLSNSSSTGVVTATLGNAAAYSVWGNSTASSAAPSYTANPNVNSVVLQGATSGSSTLSVTATAGTLNLGSTNATVTSTGILSGVGFQAGNAGSFEAKGTTQSIVVQGGQDAAANSAFGGVTLRGGDQTGAGGAGSIGGVVLIRGGNNAGTNTASKAGSVELVAGQSTGATQGLQGLISEAGSEVKGATVTQWNLECPSSTTAMTVADCGASPGNWMGIAETVNTNTVVYIFHGYTLVNASAAVTIGDTVCAGTTAGQVTDSGGTTACVLGSQVGIVRATSGTFQLGDGTSITPTTTKPLILIARD